MQIGTLSSTCRHREPPKSPMPRVGPGANYAKNCDSYSKNTVYLTCFHLCFSETVSRVSECRLQRHIDPLQVRPFQRGGDPVHVLGDQDAAQGRGRVHKQCWAGAQWTPAQREDRGLEEHDWCESTKHANAVWLCGCCAQPPLQDRRPVFLKFVSV